jgi:SAM-dependent methyltransferase
MELTLPEQVKVWERCLSTGGYEPDTPDPELATRLQGLPVQARRAIDLGCGRGRHTLWLAAHGWRTTALDWAQAALASTHKLLEEAGLNAQLLRGDLHNTNLPNGHFHLVLATHVIHHGRLRDFRRALQEIKRLLAIGGRAVISVPGRANAPQDTLGLWLEDGTVVLGAGPEAGLPHHFFTRAELEHETRVFRETRIERVAAPYPPGRGPLYEGHENEWWWLTLVN